MTAKARSFMIANEQSPVVYGSVVTDPKRRDLRGVPISLGCYYRLKNGLTFKLTVAECRIVGQARWDFEEA